MQKIVWEAGQLCGMFILIWKVFPPALFFLVFTLRRGRENNWLHNLWGSFQREKMQGILLKNNYSGTWEVAHSVRYLSCKHGDPSPVSRTYTKNSGHVTGEVRQDNSWGSPG